MFEEWRALVGKKRLRRAHSAGGPAGEDYGGEHVLPFSACPFAKWAQRVLRNSISCARRPAHSGAPPPAPRQCSRQFLAEKARQSPVPSARRRVRILPAYSRRFPAPCTPTKLCVCFRSFQGNGLPCALPKLARACLPCARASQSPGSSTHSDESSQMHPRSSRKSPAPSGSALYSQMLRGRPPLQCRNLPRWPPSPLPSKRARRQRDKASAAAGLVLPTPPASPPQSNRCCTSLQCFP